MSTQRVLDELGGVDSARPAAPTPPSHANRPEATRRIVLWDLPVRIFHWSLLAAVTTAIVTGKLGGDWMTLHGKAGLAIVGLLAFRLSWGFLGSSPARFTHFTPTPNKLLAYLQGRWRGIGHNPLGALSVIALLLVLAVQAGTGLFGNDEIAFTGPLASHIEEALSLWLTGWHHRLVNLLFVLLGLHVAAILFYVHVKKQKLVRPMVTGWKDVPADLPQPRQAGPVALAISVLIGAAAVYLANGGW